MTHGEVSIYRVQGVHNMHSVCIPVVGVPVVEGATRAWWMGSLCSKSIETGHFHGFGQTCRCMQEEKLMGV